jgi:SAM-dependent methyltransferase
LTAPAQPRARKTADWWDTFWRRPQAARGRDLTCRRTAEETLRLLAPELAAFERGGSRSGPSRPTFRLLDLGCGNGDLTPLLLADPRLDVVALDLSAEALGQFREHAGEPLPDRLRLLRGSVYSLPFADGAFDAVVSFGYASAASYEGVEPEVARVLRVGGVAIVDFANPSLYHWLGGPRATLDWYRRFRAPGNGQYHFGRRGLAAHFGAVGLRLDAVRYLNAYPPLDALAGRSWCAAADRRLAGALGPLLGRLLLARFRKGT